MTRKPELFVESSALLAWLLWEANGPAVAKVLRSGAVLWVSALAGAECNRALARAAADSRITIATLNAARRKLMLLLSACRVVPVDAEILERTGRPFPVEPVRTLDAIHLASLERARLASPRIELLSLATRVRENASRSGATLVPR